MKPRTLASIGAVLLYLWCEFFQASPFALAGREVGPGAPIPGREVVGTSAEEEAKEASSGALFGAARLVR